MLVNSVLALGVNITFDYGGYYSEHLHARAGVCYKGIPNLVTFRVIFEDLVVTPQREIRLQSYRGFSCKGPSYVTTARHPEVTMDGQFESAQYSIAPSLLVGNFSEVHAPS